MTRSQQKRLAKAAALRDKPTVTKVQATAPRPTISHDTELPDPEKILHDEITTGKKQGRWVNLGTPLTLARMEAIIEDFDHPNGWQRPHCGEIDCFGPGDPPPIRVLREEIQRIKNLNEWAEQEERDRQWSLRKGP